MYTIEMLETLNVQLDEINYFMTEFCNDYRVEIPKKERWKMDEIRNFIQSSKEMAKSMLNKQRKKF